jgi:hypothetical protein
VPVAAVTAQTAQGPYRVLVERRAPKDSMGDPTGPPVVHEIAGCLLAPGASGEDNDRAERVTSTWDLYGPEDADLLAQDRVTVPDLGLTAEVDGDPKRWPGAGVVAALRRVTG